MRNAIFGGIGIAQTPSAATSTKTTSVKTRPKDIGGNRFIRVVPVARQDLLDCGCRLLLSLHRFHLSHKGGVMSLNRSRIWLGGFVDCGVAKHAHPSPSVMESSF
jgi:hypothetical protein